MYTNMSTQNLQKVYFIWQNVYFADRIGIIRGRERHNIMEISNNNLSSLRIKEALNDNSLRAIDLSEKTGIPKATISHYVTGRRVPSRNTASELGRILGVNPAWLMGFNVPKYIETSEHEKELLLSYFSQLTPDQQESVLNLIKNMV